MVNLECVYTNLQKLIVDSEGTSTTPLKLIVDSEVRGTTLQKLSHIPQDLGLNSPIASRNALGNLRMLFSLVPRGDTRLSNPDTWTFWYLLKFLPFVNHIRNRYHSTAIYNCNPLFELVFLTTYRSLRCFYQVLIYRVIYMALIHYKYKIILYIPLNEISESQITLTPFTVSSCPKLITYKMSFCSSTKSSYMFASFSWVKFTHLS